MLENHSKGGKDHPTTVMKRRRIIKDKSRIPGISVGDEANTTVGEKKKVCFNINGRWVFRMVDPGWRAPGRPQKGRGRKSEVGDQKSEARGQKSESRDRRTGHKGSATKSKGARPKEGDGE